MNGAQDWTRVAWWYLGGAAPLLLAGALAGPVFDDPVLASVFGMLIFVWVVFCNYVIRPRYGMSRVPSLVKLFRRR